MVEFYQCSPQSDWEYIHYSRSTKLFLQPEIQRLGVKNHIVDCYKLFLMLFSFFTWKCELDTHLDICLNKGSSIFLNCVGSITSKISSISPKNITCWYKRNTSRSMRIFYITSANKQHAAQTLVMNPAKNNVRDCNCIRHPLFFFFFWCERSQSSGSATWLQLPLWNCSFV